MGFSRFKRALLGVAVSATMIGAPTAGHAATTVVYPASMGVWAFNNPLGTSGAATFEEGPGTPLGHGSLRQSVGANAQQAVQTAAYNGVALGALSIQYSTYSTTPNGAYINLSVDYKLGNGDPGNDGFSDETLVFDPTEQGVPVPINTWATWSASAGKWWSTSNPGGPGGPKFTFAQFLAQPGKSGAKLANFVSNPNNAAVRFQIGSTGGSPYVGFLDDVRINGTTYDFEAARFTSVVTVRPSAMERFVGWTATCGGAGTGSKSFVTGPATPPAGTGSFELKTGSNGNSVEALRNTGYSLKRLDTMTALRYGTYVTANMGGQAPYLVLDIDFDNNLVADDRMFFEPEYQSYIDPSAPVLTTGQWQLWNALKGGWWSNNDPDMSPGTGVKTIAFYLTKHPLARILNVGGLGGIRVQAGCGVTSWNNFNGNADRLSIGFDWATSVYNFETDIGGGGGDFTPPVAPVITLPSAGGLTASPASIQGLAEAGSTVRVYEGATLKGTTIASPGGAFTVNVPFTTGPHTVTATATDAALNVSTPSAARSWEVDATPPSITVSPAGSPVIVGAINDSGSATDNKGVIRIETAYFIGPLPTTGGGNAACGGCGPTATSVTWSHIAGTGPGYIEARYTAVDVVGNRTTVVVNYLVI